MTEVHASHGTEESGKPRGYMRIGPATEGAQNSIDGGGIILDPQSCEQVSADISSPLVRRPACLDIRYERSHEALIRIGPGRNGHELERAVSTSWTIERNDRMGGEAYEQPPHPTRLKRTAPGDRGGIIVAATPPS